MGGWNPDAMAWDLPPDQAAILDNFLIRPGKIIMRGGFGTYGTFASGSPINPCGWVGGNGGSFNWWQIQSRATSVGGTLCDPWSAPLAAATAGVLAQPTGTLRFVSLGATSTVAVTADQAPGPRWINFDGLLYGISYGASTAPTTSQDTNANYTTTNTNLLTLPWKLTTATAPTAHPAAPRGAFDLAGYQSRIWLLGGVDTPGGLTAHEPATLFFTNPIASGGGFVGADWKDPTTGTTNKIKMDNDSSDYGVGLAVVRGAMLVFRRNSVWVLRGSTTSNYSLLPLARDVGCIDARSIVETHEGVYFLSMQGLMLTNGTSIVNVSGTITNTLRDAIFSQQILSTNSGVNFQPTYATAVQTSQGQIMISLGVHQAATGNYLPVFAATYDPHSRTWVRITSSLWSSGSGDSTVYNSFPFTNYSPNMYPGPLIGKDNPEVVTAIGDKWLTMLEDLQYGYSFLSPENTFNGAAGGLYDVDNNASGFGAAVIPAIWQTGLVPIVSTSRRKWGQAKRMYLDYRLSADSNFSASNGFRVTPINTYGQQIGTVVLNTPSPIGGTYGGFINGFSVQTTSGPLQVARANQDWSNELLSDVALQVSLPGTGGITNKATMSQAEIYGVGLEFQNTSEARTTGSS